MTARTRRRRAARHERDAGRRRPAPAGAGRRCAATCGSTAWSSPLGLIVVLFQIWTDGDPAAAAQRHQHGAAERLHPDPGDRHGDRHHRGPHRPVGRARSPAFVGAMSAVLMIKHDMPWPLAVAALPAARRRDRCVAGVLDRLRRHPVVHRDAGRHAALPRRHRSTCWRASRSRPFPEGLQTGQPAASCPSSAPDTIYHWPHPHPRRRRDRARGGPGGPRRGAGSSSTARRPAAACSSLKCVAIVAAVLGAFTLLLASYRGVPVVGSSSRRCSSSTASSCATRSSAATSTPSAATGPRRSCRA